MDSSFSIAKYTSNTKKYFLSKNQTYLLTYSSQSVILTLNYLIFMFLFKKNRKGKNNFIHRRHDNSRNCCHSLGL